MSFQSDQERGLKEIYAKYYPKAVRNTAFDRRIVEICARVVPDAAVSLTLFELGLNEPLPTTPSTPQPMNYADQQAQLQANAAITTQDQANDKAWVEILTKYDILDIEANKSMVKDYCGGVITLEKFQFLQANTPRGFKLLFGDERESLLSQIKDRLTDPYGRRMSTFDLDNWMKKYASYDRMELRAELAKITERQEMAAKPVKQIKAELQQHREAEHQSKYGYTDKQGNIWPRLLSTIVLRGTVTAISTPAYLRDLIYRPRSDGEATFEYKRLCRLYGTEQVTWMQQQP